MTRMENVILPLPMRVLSADFLRSATGPGVGVGWPDEDKPEIAFAGRSNVGKSSLLNALCGHKLGRVSNTPGRTRLINFFELVVDGPPRQELRFVDLPGYGYAKVSKSERKEWFAFVERYLGHRASLKACVLLMDARRGAELDETELSHYLGDRGVAVLAVATKADKLSKHERKPAAETIKKTLGVAPLIVSAQTGDGVEALWERLRVAVRPPLP
jgi:GTP-binding protein